MKKNLLILLSVLFVFEASSQRIVYLENLEKLDTHEVTTVDDIVFIPGEAGGYFKAEEMEKKGKLCKTKRYEWKRIIPASSELSPLWFGAKNDNKNDDTEAVQKAIDALPDYGGVVSIPLGCIFRLKDLKFSQKTILKYYETSDKSVDAGTTKVSNEAVYFIANANNDGIVNEQHIAAPFHPGLILNVEVI